MRLAGVARFGLALAALGLVGAAPAAWVDYARAIGERIQTRLGRADDPAVARLRGVLDEQPAGQTDQPRSRVVLRVWLDAQGHVAHAEFASLGDAEADDTLRSILAGVVVGQPPPTDMPQPVALALRITPASPE